MIGLGSGGVVVIIVVVIVAISLLGGSTPAQKGVTPVPASLVKQVTAVPPSVLNQVGIGGNSPSKTPSANPVNPVVGGAGGAAGGNPTLPPVNGKPSIFYFGAEWCPYCATERWSMITALSRFGTFKGLKGVYSSAGDVYPNTPTFTFHGSSYSSPYIAFLPVEIQDVNKAALDTPTTPEDTVLAAWDPHGSFPFLDIAGRYIGGLPAWINPGLLQGLSRSDIAQTLSIPSNAVGSALDANANYLTAAICAVDGGKPGAVCNSAGVKAATKVLQKLPKAVPIS